MGVANILSQVRRTENVNLRRICAAPGKRLPDKISLTIRGLFFQTKIMTALAKLTGDTFLAELALPIVELGFGDYPSS